VQDAADAAEKGHVVLALDHDEQLHAGLEPGAKPWGGRAE